MPTPTNLPPAIRTDASNPFAHRSMRERLAGILAQTSARNPDYPPAVHRALDELRQGIETNAEIPPLTLPAPDRDCWQPALAARRGERWLATDWFFAEMYAYRLVIEAVRWWENGRDPFAPHKAALLAGEAPEEQLEPLLESVPERIPSERTPSAHLVTLLRAALWGNRVDLSHPAGMTGQETAADDLLVDDSVAVARWLDAIPENERPTRPLHLVADNVGTELASDLALADALLARGHPLVLHLKMHPTLVSDAIRDDVLAFLQVLASAGPNAAALGDRLQRALDDGRLRLAPDLYWNGPRPLWELPPRLKELFTAATLVIFKGDANYRRVVGDRLWPPETPLASVTASFPAPLVLLRTLKSDAVVGLPAGLAATLDAADRDWRTNGRRGVIQASLPPAGH